MTNKVTGLVVFAAALGMMFGLMAVDITQLKDWNEVFTPTFVGSLFGHIAVVITAFVGGKLIPTDDRDSNLRTRAEDKIVTIQEDKKR